MKGDLPLFFQPTLPEAPGASLPLDEATARHIVQVLRMQPGERLALTDGQGCRASATLSAAGKKTCTVTIETLDRAPRTGPSLALGVAFTKTAARNEWLLEKAAEMGVAAIYPLQTARAESGHFRRDRFRQILISAMLQSQQYHLPELSDPLSMTGMMERVRESAQKLIAHCMEGDKTPLHAALEAGRDTCLLIGPEGDFTPAELEAAQAQGFKAVSLGHTRLRTETAALLGCACFRSCNG